MHVVTAAALAPPQELAGQALAQRLVEVVARKGTVAQAVVDGLADSVQRLHRRDAVQAPPGVPDDRPCGILVGRLEPSAEDREILPCDGQRRPADAGYEHELVECLWSDVRARGERERGRARRRVLQPHHGGGPRPARTQARGQVVTRKAERERLPAREVHRRSVHRMRISRGRPEHSPGSWA
jgi:hypothetical protein